MEDSSYLHSLPLQHGTYEPKKRAIEPCAEFTCRYNKVVLLRLQPESSSSARSVSRSTSQHNMIPAARLATVLALATFATAQTNPEDQAFLTSTAAPTSIAPQTIIITTTATITQTGSAAPEITAVSDCHPHGTVK